MSSFSVGKPQSTSKPAITVDAGLAAGFHRFRLVVLNEAGKPSQPDELVVRVLASPASGGGAGITTQPILVVPTG